MKKFAVIILVLSLSLSLIACRTEETISPTVQAYIDIAQEQMSEGDFEAAIKTLEQGIEVTDSEELKDMLLEAIAKQSEQEAEESEDSENTPVTQEEEPVVQEETVVEAPPSAPVVNAEEQKKQSARENFYQRASVIENYSNANLDTAMTQTDMNIESGIVAEKWDALLNDIYKYHKNTMSKSDFEALKADERAWIEIKESAAEAAAAEFAGGTAAPLARNSTLIDYTRDRCYYLISLI